MLKDQERNYQEITSKVTEYVPIVTALSEKVDTITGVIGSTGSGKSAMLGFLLNAKMTYKKLKGARYIINHDNSGRYPTIGNGMESCTTIPSIYQVNGANFVDLSGWFQTRSVNQEIINAYLNSGIFKKGMKVKIVIVAQIYSLLTCRGGNLVDIVQRLSQFFQNDLTIMINSITLVLSKVDTDDWDTNAAIKQIQQIGKANNNLTKSTKFLIETLVRNKRVCFFPTPDKLTDHIAVIQKQINRLNPTVLSHDGCVTISDKANNMVNSYISKLNTQIKELSKKVALQIKSKFLNKKLTNGTEVNQELCKIRMADNILKAQFGKTAGAKDYVKALEELKKNLQVSVQSSKQMSKCFTMVDFYSNLNGKINVKSTFIQTVSLELTQNLGRLQMLREKFSSQEEIKKMQAAHKEQMKKREKQNQDLIKKSQQQKMALENKHNEMLLKQKQENDELIKKSDEKSKALMDGMDKQIEKLKNRPTTTIHVYRSRWCEIM